MMPAPFEDNQTLMQAQGSSAEAAAGAARKPSADAVSTTRGIVNGLAIGLIFWAAAIYFLMK